MVALQGRGRGVGVGTRHAPGTPVPPGVLLLLLLLAMPRLLHWQAEQRPLASRAEGAQQQPPRHRLLLAQSMLELQASPG